MALYKFAQELADEAFSPHSPEFSQEHLSVEKYVEILAQLKPKFIHHARCKELIRGLLSDLGCDVNETHFDVPRLRTMTSDNYLTAGLAYAFTHTATHGLQPHRVS